MTTRLLSHYAPSLFGCGHRFDFSPFLVLVLQGTFFRLNLSSHLPFGACPFTVNTPFACWLRARRPVCSWCDYGLLVPRFHFIVLPPISRIYGDFGCVNKTLSALIRSDRNWTKSVVKSTKRLHESLNEICF